MRRSLDVLCVVLLRHISGFKQTWMNVKELFASLKFWFVGLGMRDFVRFESADTKCHILFPLSHSCLLSCVSADNVTFYKNLLQTFFKKNHEQGFHIVTHN